MFAWENKASGKNLDAALKQLLTYSLALENPPILVAHFLTQCVFCLFAEDVGLLPSRMFERLLTNLYNQRPAWLAFRPPLMLVRIQPRIRDFFQS